MYYGLKGYHNEKINLQESYSKRLKKKSLELTYYPRNAGLQFENRFNNLLI